MCESARANLAAAISIITQCHAQIAALEPTVAYAELEEQREQLKRAEEVRTTCALQILSEAVDEYARELVDLNIRRQELTVMIRGFLKMDFMSAGQTQAPATSRLVSVALLYGGIDAEDSDGTIAAAASGWKARMSALFASADVDVTAGGSDTGAPIA